MSGETPITIVGTVREIDLKFLDSGATKVRIKVVTSPRKFNAQTNQWEKKTGKFWECEAWNAGKMLLAENIAETLKEGDNVILTGDIETEEWTTQDGQKRRSDTIRIEAIGKDLRWHQQPATVQAYANTNQQYSAGQPQNSGWGGSQPGPNTQTGNNSPDGWGAPPPGEPPF